MCRSSDHEDAPGVQFASSYHNLCSRLSDFKRSNLQRREAKDARNEEALRKLIAKVYPGLDARVLL